MEARDIILAVFGLVMGLLSWLLTRYVNGLDRQRKEDLDRQAERDKKFDATLDKQQVDINALRLAQEKCVHRDDWNTWQSKVGGDLQVMKIELGEIRGILDEMRKDKSPNRRK